MLNKYDKINEIFSLLNNKGDGLYGLSSVTQKHHALQCALLAEAENEKSEMIVAALLHDIGHMLHDLGEDFADNEVDDYHENIGMLYLKGRVSERVFEPIALHVDAKRYLCALDTKYFQILSEDSRKSLELQGGIMNYEQRKEFEKNTYWREALRLRRYDDMSKNPEAITPEPEYFFKHLDFCFH